MPIPIVIVYLDHHGALQSIQYNNISAVVADAPRLNQLVIASVSIGPGRYVDLKEIDYYSRQPAIGNLLGFVNAHQIPELNIHAVHSEVDRQAFYPPFQPTQALQCLRVEGTFFHMKTMADSFSWLTDLQLRDASVTDAYGLTDFLTAMSSWFLLERLELVNYLSAVDDSDDVPHGYFACLPSLKHLKIDDEPHKAHKLLSYMRLDKKTNVDVVVRFTDRPFPVNARDVLSVLSPFHISTVLPILSKATTLTVDARNGLKVAATAKDHGRTKLEVHVKHSSDDRSTLLDSALFSLADLFRVPGGGGSHPLRELNITGDLGAIAQHSWERAYRKFPNLHGLHAVDTIESPRSVRGMFAGLRLVDQVDQTPVCFNLDTLQLVGALYSPALVDEVEETLEVRKQGNGLLASLSMSLVWRGAGHNDLNYAENEMRGRLCGQDLLGIDYEPERLTIMG